MAGLDERSRGSSLGEARMNLRLPVLLVLIDAAVPKSVTLFAPNNSTTALSRGFSSPLQGTPQ